MSLWLKVTEEIVDGDPTEHTCVYQDVVEQGITSLLSPVGQYGKYKPYP